jgi:hypothetical protein
MNKSGGAAAAVNSSLVSCNPSLATDAQDNACLHFADRRLNGVHMLEKHFEICASSLENDHTKSVADGVRQAGEVTVNGKDHIKPVGGESEELTVLRAGPANFLNGLRCELRQRPHEGARDALINEQSAF